MAFELVDPKDLEPTYAPDGTYKETLEDKIKKLEKRKVDLEKALLSRTRATPVMIFK